MIVCTLRCDHITPQCDVIDGKCDIVHLKYDSHKDCDHIHTSVNTIPHKQ